jgi:hypothetical protein
VKASQIKEMTQLSDLDSWQFIHDRIEETSRLTAVEDITHSVLESMRPPYVCEGIGRENHDLFNFVSEFVYERVAGEFASLVDELKSEHGDEIGKIWDESHRREGKLQRMEELRRRKAEKQEERKARFGVGASNLQAWRAELAEQCLQAIGKDDSGSSDDDEEMLFLENLATEAIVSDDSVDDSVRAWPEQRYERSPALREAFLQEQIALAREFPPDRKRQVRWANYPISTHLAFLLSAVGERSLLIGRCFAQLRGTRTVFSHYSPKLNRIESQLLRPLATKDQIDEFIQLNHLTPQSPGEKVPHTPISVSCDAAAMNPDGSTLPSENSEYAFVIYGQPLDRRYSCMPLHVIKAKSGAANETVQLSIDNVCSGLEDRGFNVKYVCSDGDAGYNTRHAEFFDKWFPEFYANGLPNALRHIAGETKIPVSDFLHLWKLWLARVKNHPLTLSPDSLDHLLTSERFEEILKLRSALKDKTSIGKMRDAYALQFFSLKNCLKCLQDEHLTEFMYLLPFTLQEDVIRNTNLTRTERLAKAVLSFRLLVHYFDLCCGEHYPGVHGRFCEKRGSIAVTFAENAAWPRILNTALALIQFILEADGHWSFSRLGSHCLENFFGFIRQNSKGDDRMTRALHIIAKTHMVCLVMYELEITMKHRGRDNVGGVVIGDDPIQFEEMPENVHFLESIIELSSLACSDPTDENLLSLTEVTEQFVSSWANKDVRPGRVAPDPATSCLAIKNNRILPRIIGAEAFARMHEDELA